MKARDVFLTFFVRLHFTNNGLNFTLQDPKLGRMDVILGNSIEDGLIAWGSHEKKTNPAKYTAVCR